MKWEALNAQWPKGLPKSYFAGARGRSPDIGATSAIFVSLINAVESLERRVEILERRIRELEMWP